MTIVAVAALAALLLEAFALARVIRTLIRQHARERDLLVNQLLHATGKTWTPPPAEERAPEPADPYALTIPDQLAD